METVFAQENYNFLITDGFMKNLSLPLAHRIYKIRDQKTDGLN